MRQYHKPNNRPSLDLIYFLLSFLLLLQVSCSREQHKNLPGTHTFRTYTEDGVTISISGGSARFSEPLFQYERSTVTYSPDPEQIESYLQRPTSIAMDEDENLYITDEGSGCILIYNKSGEFQGKMGTSGSGPGEFNSIQILRFENNLLTLFDRLLQRTSIFHTSEGFLESFRLPFASGRLTSLEREPDGNYLCYTESSRFSLGYRMDIATISVYDTTGQLISKISTSPSSTFTLQANSERATLLRIPFSPHPIVLYIPSKNAILLSSGEDPILRLYSVIGELREEIRVDIPRRLVTPRDQELVYRAIDSLAAQTSDESQLYMKGQIEFPKWKAYWGKILVDHIGNYWLQYPHQFEEYLHGGPSYRVLSSSGEYLGDTRWPVRSGDIYNCKLLTLVIDPDTNEMHPVVFKITSLFPETGY